MEIAFKKGLLIREFPWCFYGFKINRKRKFCKSLFGNKKRE